MLIILRFFSVSKYIGLGFVKISSLWLESHDCCTVHLKEQVHHFHVRFWISVFIFFSFLTCQMAWGEDSFGSCVLCRPLRLTLRLTLKIYLLLFFSPWWAKPGPLASKFTTTSTVQLHPYKTRPDSDPIESNGDIVRCGGNGRVGKMKTASFLPLTVYSYLRFTQTIREGTSQ